jgi:hypothetical protein
MFKISTESVAEVVELYFTAIKISCHTPLYVFDTHSTQNFEGLLSV